MKVVVIGELNPDLILQNYGSFPALGKEVIVEDCVLTMGSATAICAMALAKLGNQVRFVSKVGPDTYGDFCTDILRKAGIDVTYVEHDPAVKTGITVSVSSARDRALITYLGAMGVYDAGGVPPAVFEGCDHLHMSAYFLQAGLRPHFAGLMRQARSQGLTTSLDPGFDPAETWGPDLRETLKEADVFFPNEVELRGVTGEADEERAVRSLSNGRTLTVAKLGARGCLTVFDGRTCKQGPFPVKPVDTTGAGDTFNAGFLHAWLRREPIEQCLRFGAACGALSTLASGGTGNQPSETQALEFLSECSTV
jgi:sugar/nucleoside kinase (ribokinase family)